MPDPSPGLTPVPSNTAVRTNPIVPQNQSAGAANPANPQKANTSTPTTNIGVLPEITSTKLVEYKPIQVIFLSG